MVKQGIEDQIKPLLTALLASNWLLGAQMTINKPTAPRLFSKGHITEEHCSQNLTNLIYPDLNDSLPDRWHGT